MPSRETSTSRPRPFTPLPLRRGRTSRCGYELVQLALEHGADPNLRQGGGFTAIDAARQNGDERVEQLLLDHGAGP